MRGFNFVLRPADVLAQSNAAIRMIQVNRQTLAEACSRAETYLNDVRSQILYSGGYRNVGLMMEDLQKVIRGMQLAYDRDIVDYKRLNAAVAMAGGENLIGATIDRIIIELERERRDLVVRLNGIRSGCNMCPLITSTLWGFLLQCSCVRAAQASRNSINALIEAQDEELKYWNDKAKLYWEIEDATKYLFSETKAIYEKASDGIRIMKDAAGNLPDGYNNSYLDAWRLEFQEVKGAIDSIYDYFDIDPSHMQRMINELGYTREEVIGILANLDTEEDLRFFRYLMHLDEEGFANAFKISPRDLSTEMAMITADFVGRMFEPNENGDFVPSHTFFDFSNALLRNGYFCAGSGMSDSFFHREAYFEMLFAASFTLTQLSAYYLGINGGTEEEFRQHNLMHGLTGIWGSKLFVFEDYILGVQNRQRLEEFSLSSLSIDRNGNGSFEIMYPSGRDDLQPISRDSQVGMGFTRSFIINNVEEFARLNEAIDSFARDFAIDLARGATFTAVGVAFPKALPFVTAAAVATGQRSSVSGSSSWGETRGQKGWLAGGELVFNQIMQGTQGWQQLQNQRDETCTNTFMNYFGVALGSSEEGENGRATHIGIGLLDPVRLSYAWQWQQEGLSEVFGWSERQISSLGLTRGSDAYLMVNGGFPILRENEHGTFDGERFANAVESISNRMHGNNAMFFDDIKEEWISFLRHGIIEVE